jgi:capsule polysaccharide modification protein KpsS
MAGSAQKATEHFGETKGIANHDHDLIHELSNRLDALWRYDQYIANASSDEKLQSFWRNLKEQEQQNINDLKKLVAQHAQAGCF